MITIRHICLTLIPAMVILLAGAALSDDEISAPADSMSTDSTSADTTALSLPLRESDTLLTDSAQAAIDTLGLPEVSVKEPEEPLPPPARLVDSLARYFGQHAYKYDVKYLDLYPRNGAGFLYHEASYFTMTCHETPLRTTVSPFGLPAGQINIQSGANRMRPFDRIIPADGRLDFDDIPTADVASASIIEGPLSAFASLDGGISMLYLEPSQIPPEVPESEFTVERGAYGYAYTRARIARMFAHGFGFSFATDYRKGDGLITSADDDSYYVKTHLLKKYGRRTTLDFYVNVHRRKGGFPVQPVLGGYDFRRLRRDRQFIASVTRQEFYGGQLISRFEYGSSKSAYSAYTSPVYRNIKPRFTDFELSYLLPRERGLYQLTIKAGKQQCDIDHLYHSRNYGCAFLAGIIDRFGGRLFFFSRLRKAKGEDIGIEGAAGLAKSIVGRWRTILSVGFLTRWPDLTDRFAPEKIGAIGTSQIAGNYCERGNPDLVSEKKLTGNAAISYDNGNAAVSVSLNTGMADDIIYYDRRFDKYPAGEVFPDNDNTKFADLNLSGSINEIGPFFFKASLTGRRVDSDRYGNRPPYSPRWQVYSQLGVRHYVEKYQVHLRLFGDVTYAEKPLSYKLAELETGAVVTGGFNASLKALTFYYMIHNLLNQVHLQPEGYGYSGWFYSWGFNWKFLD